MNDNFNLQYYIENDVWFFQMTKCQFCPVSERKFTCPRCNADYCSLKCYQVTSRVTRCVSNTVNCYL